MIVNINHSSHFVDIKIKDGTEKNVIVEEASSSLAIALNTEEPIAAFSGT